jgi:uncharacterized protein (TIGR03437 family)
MKFLHALIATASLAVCAFGQTTQGTFNTGQAARLIIGQNNFTAGDFGATNTLLGSPSGIAIANGTLWVVDANRLAATPDNNRVLRYSNLGAFPTPAQDPQVQGTTCSVCVGQASLVVGQPDFVSSGYALNPTGMRNPTAVATDGNVLVVADTDNNRVLIWNSLPKANGQPPDVVVGQPDLVHGGTSVPPTATSLRGPEGVWVAGGKLYIADTQDNRVLIYNHIPTSNNAAADVVIGQASFTSFVSPDLTTATAAPAANNMQDPVSVTTDGTHMFVADLGQNRVLIWNTIPSTNNAPADVAVGQPDLVSAISNNSYKITNATLDADNYPEGVSPVLCQANAAWAANQYQTVVPPVDSAGTPIYPPRCAATLSLPRMALSDGKRLFIADGGNDRVLVYNSIPTVSGQPADSILGEPDEFSDNTGDNPDGANAFQTPVSLAWDSANQNLYVSDTYNRRIVVYSPGVLNIPLNGILNSASLEIYALGSVAISGTITAKDTITITINGTAYAYTVATADTLQTITDNIVKVINKAPDPNVVASADDTTDTVVLTARQGGAAGGNITYSATTSTNATEVATPSGSSLNIYLENPTVIAPGTLIDVFGQNLCDTTASADLTQPYLPFSLNGCALYIDGNRVPLLYASPTQVNAQMPWEYADRTSVSVVMRTMHADGSVTVTAPIAVTIAAANPGIFALNGNDPRPGIIYHAFSSATDLLTVNGSINPGDIATITIANAAGTTTATYNYTVKSTDSLTTITAALVNAINSAPDPNIYATATNEYTQILLTALIPGPAGNGLAISASVAAPSPVPTGSSSTAGLVLTVVNATTCCASVAGAPVTATNPAVPGEILYLLATGLGPTTPSDQDTGKVFTGGSANPPLTPVDTVVVGASSGQVINVALVPGLVGIYYVQFQIPTSLATDLNTQMHIAQGANISNIVTFPVVVP